MRSGSIPARALVPTRGALCAAVLALLAAGLACSREGVQVPAAGTPLARLEETSTSTPRPPSATPEPASATPVPLAAPSSTPAPMRTPEPPASPTLPATPTQVAPTSLPLLYHVQAGDTLGTVAIRFGVAPEEVRPIEGSLPLAGLLSPGLRLAIPARLGPTSSHDQLIPDSEVVYSASAANFDIAAFARRQAGYLATYQSQNGPGGGAAILQQLALDNSVNPRVLLTLLEQFGRWVTGRAPSGTALDYPMGIVQPSAQGFAPQLVQATNRLGIGYYGWREASLVDLTFKDGTSLRLAPDLNAGTAAILYYFSVDAANQVEWQQGVSSFFDTYRGLFGDPFARAERFEPLYHPDLTQPVLELPFYRGQRWAFTGGPHGAWEHEGARAALDFAPPSTESGCAVSALWVTASAAGLVVRSEGGVVVLDLDGDGLEQTGWDLLYLHISSQDRVAVGQRVEQGDALGHPSCEGGIATGTHVHLARKYNGEWMLADGPLPFVLSGWRAQAGTLPYQGTLVRGKDIAIACPCASVDTLVWR